MLPYPTGDRHSDPVLKFFPVRNNPFAERMGVETELIPETVAERAGHHPILMVVGSATMANLHHVLTSCVAGVIGEFRLVAVIHPMAAIAAAMVLALQERRPKPRSPSRHRVTSR
jgi:hypothetical protein